MNTHVPVKPLSSFVTIILLTISLIAAPHAQEQPAGNASALSAAVLIGNFTFTPAEITVAPGTTVTWTNGDDIPHTVTATNKAFRSKAMDTDQRYSFTFTVPGTYDYFCSLHPQMQGKVIVK
jgi:amicyanin